MGVDFCKFFCLLSVQKYGKLRLCGAAVKVGHVGCSTVRFGFADALRVLRCRVGLSYLFMGVQLIAIKR